MKTEELTNHVLIVIFSRETTIFSVFIVPFQKNIIIFLKSL